MAPKNPPGTKISLKLLVDTKSQKVLYAEAGKQFVDFLFGLLHIPIGTMIGSGIMMKEGGSLREIYKSAAVLCTSHLQPNFLNSKDSILMPITSSKHCKLGHENNDQGNGGYVKGKFMYMVLDDLTIKPMSALNSIRLVNELKIDDVGSLEEVIVVVGFKQCVEMLMTSFVSDSVLTDVLYSTKNGEEDEYECKDVLTDVLYSTKSGEEDECKDKKDDEEDKEEEEEEEGEGEEEEQINGEYAELPYSPYV